MRLYLDTSALVKRYIKEPGSDRVKKMFVDAYNGDALLYASIFNIGEAMSAMHKATRKAGRPDVYPVLRGRLLGDVRRLTRLGAMRLVPLTVALILDAGKYVERHGLYIADALQIASAAKAQSPLVTGDEKLCNIAAREGVECLLV